MEPGAVLFILIALGLVACVGWAAWCALVAGAAVWGSLKLLGLDDFESY